MIPVVSWIVSFHQLEKPAKRRSSRSKRTSIIFTNPATDGYTSDNATSLLEQNQVILDQRIFPANYDVGMVLDGHVYAYQPGQLIFQGAAQFQSLCGNAKKGKAVSIFRSIEPIVL
jgi:hypothetical protein